MNKEYINRISKYFYHFITKIKIKKSKEDSRKLKELELALSKAEEEKEIEKFKGQHQKIFNILDKLNTKSENVCEKYVKKMTQLNDYEEKFIVRDIQRDCVA